MSNWRGNIYLRINRDVSAPDSEIAEARLRKVVADEIRGAHVVLFEHWRMTPENKKQTGLPMSDKRERARMKVKGAANV